MSTPTIHTLTARAMFGLLGDPDPAPAPALRRQAAELVAALGPGQIALITGPSGAGKSSLARAVIGHCHTHAIPAISTIPSDPDAPPRPHGLWTPDLRRLCAPACTSDPTAVDLLTGPLPRRLRLLASVGLADARLFVRSARVLSVGERSRLDIALALDAVRHRSGVQSAGHAPILVLDEFASTLDRPTAARSAQLLGRCVRRAAARPGAPRVICVTAHDDLSANLHPDLHVHVWPAGRRDRLAVKRIKPLPRVPPHSSLRIPRASPLCPCGSGFESSSPCRRGCVVDDILYQPGTYADYAALAHHHYRAARPAMLAGPHAIRRALDARSGGTVGVLVAAMPTLNASWRAAAWPAHFNTGDKRADAARLSRDLRTIARVIVAPTHRGLGIASALVRHYLADPLTPATEALAAMGHACPFFESAGMAAYRLPPTPRDARLLDALAYVGLTPAALLGPSHSRAHEHAVRLPRVRGRCRARLCEHDGGGMHPQDGSAPPLLLRELRLWANRSRSTRHLINDPHAIALRAAEALLARPIAYAHVAPVFAATTLPTIKDAPNAPLRHAA